MVLSVGGLVDYLVVKILDLVYLGLYFGVIIC